MKKVIKWIKDNRFVATIIAVLSVVAGAILVVLILGWWGIIDLDKTTSAGELLRTFILCIGAIGGVYGLHLATERQKTFSDQVQGQLKQVQLLSEQVQGQSEQVQVLSQQVQVQADQSFNERLGRGVELLAKDNVTMRSAGVRVLIDLANNVTEAQKPIVANIIFDFFRNKASVRLDDKHKHLPIPEGESRQDVQSALDFLVSVSVNERENLYPNWLDEGRLDFCDLDFGYLDFSNKTLKKINFSGSHIYRAKFENVNIEEVQFHESSIKRTHFFNTKFKKILFSDSHIERSIFLHGQIAGSSFESGKITQSKFFGTSIKDVKFIDFEIKSARLLLVKIMNVKFNGVKFDRGKFEIRHEIKVYSKDSLPHFTSTDLGVTIFDFDDSIEVSDFFELCYYEASQQSSKMDTSRRYYSLKGWGYVFVKSDKIWSEKPLEAWIEWERMIRGKEEVDKEAYLSSIAESMPEQEYQQVAKDPIEDAEESLKRQIESLKRFKEKQKKPNPPK